jgi:hypothetical protein
VIGDIIPSADKKIQINKSKENLCPRPVLEDKEESV